MDGVIQVAVLGLTGALLALLLNRQRPELGLLLALAVGVLILLFSLDLTGEILDFMNGLAEQSLLPEELFRPLLKTVGIAIVTHLAAQLCRDAKEGAIGSFIETAGGVAAIYVALPLMSSVLEMIESLV